MTGLDHDNIAKLVENQYTTYFQCENERLVTLLSTLSHFGKLPIRIRKLLIRVICHQSILGFLGMWKAFNRLKEMYEIYLWIPLQIVY